MVELERMHSHFLWAGVGSEDLSFLTIVMQINAFHKKVMNTLDTSAGCKICQKSWKAYE